MALELLQSYLLIQDDWMDGDIERRGGPSAHVALDKKLGGATKGAAEAILAGDSSSWSMAVEVLTKLDVAPERRVAALGLFCQIHEDVVIGQALDTLSRDVDIEELHVLKTGSYTVRGALLLGATLAGADAATLSGLERFAAPVGVAFQLRDDSSSASSARKNRRVVPKRATLRSAKNTAVVREARPLLSAEGQKKLDAVWGKPAAERNATSEAVLAIEASGARQKVETRLKDLCDEAESLALGLYRSRLRPFACPSRDPTPSALFLPAGRLAQAVGSDEESSRRRESGAPA